MNIGYFTNSFPYKCPITRKKIRDYIGGGVGIVSFELASRMAKLGHNVFVFAPSINKKKHIFDYDNIKIIRYKKLFNIGQTPTSLEVLYKPILSNYDLDLVHAHIGSLPAPLGAYVYSKFKNKPFLITHHGDWIGGYGTALRKLGVFVYKRYLSNELFNEANRIIALSNSHLNGSDELVNYEEKIEIIPNGIDIKKFKIDESKKFCKKKYGIDPHKKVILFFGVLTPRKGPKLLLKAFQKVIEEQNDINLVFAGSGELENKLKLMSDEMGIDDFVKFLGYVPESEKKYVYNMADVFTLPSYREAFPLTLLEASAVNLPLIVSDLECFKNFVEDGINGLYFQKGNEEQLAEKILKLVNSKKLRKKMGDKAKTKAENYTWEEIIKKYESLYHKVLEDKT